MAIQNSNLLSSFVNEVVKIAEDETIVQSNLQSVSDVYSWIEEYGRTLDTKWYLRSSRPSGTREKFAVGRLRCRESLPYLLFTLSMDFDLKRSNLRGDRQRAAKFIFFHELDSKIGLTHLMSIA
ncbi:hypothetical protein AVEN_16402-1 [Araneus ventricosus]|uniref:Uncharacterized protein n=1 Tax=Araneus ventricosus TaxID=182803 RepID=A0A4Y2X9W0_ARAVE|nr:hypothetical protein AVEN_261621-1 [Araneus ventricosus]GBO46445.1 hypothetical protein AVEN_16402-1 [Araneus ventricosus]